jgi:hypothetical protein
MRPDRFAATLLCPLLLATLSIGCQALHRYRPVLVQVRDAETKQPIAEAQVRISYPFTRPSWAPWECCEPTGEDGVAHLRAAPYGKAGVLLEASAANYLSEQQSHAADTIAAIKPAPLFAPHKEDQPVHFVLDLYAGPEPSVELIVPSGYLGLVKATVQVLDDLPPTPGQRAFRFEVSTSGEVLVKGPAILRRVSFLEFRAHYPSGTVLSQHPDVADVGLRWLKTDGNDQYFVVGTQSDYDRICREMNMRGGSERPPAGGAGGSRGGGRHHRGGQ